MKKVIVWAFLLFLLVACGGKGIVSEGPADLTPYLQEDGLFHLKAGDVGFTQELWEAVMGQPLPLVKGGKYPAGNVSWYDAQAFIRKLNELTGRKFRLPTEAEWDFRVLRSGSAATVFWKTRVSKRSENLANHFKTTMGFRLAL